MNETLLGGGESLGSGLCGTQEGSYSRCVHTSRHVHMEARGPQPQVSFLQSHPPWLFETGTLTRLIFYFYFCMLFFVCFWNDQPVSPRDLAISASLCGSSLSHSWHDQLMLHWIRYLQSPHSQTPIHCKDNDTGPHLNPGHYIIHTILMCGYQKP